MTSGQLTDRVTFLQPTKTTDSLRGQIVEWTDEVVTVWANLRALNARELLAAQAMDVTPQHLLTVRWRADLTTQMRVRIESSKVVCHVVSLLDPDGRREWLELTLVEVA